MSTNEDGKQRCRLLKVRRHMIDRCTKPNHPSYGDYGGRGIVVCRRWLESAQAFIDDMGPRPPGGTLERMDNAKGYGPENCRWATRAEQVRNRRNNIVVIVDGLRMVLMDACALRGVNYDTIWNRIRKGMDPLQALAKPVQRYTRSLGSTTPRKDRSHV